MMGLAENMVERTVDRIRFLYPVNEIRRTTNTHITNNDMIEICASADGREKEISEIFAKLNGNVTAAILQRSSVIKRLPEYYEILRLIKAPEKQINFLCLADEAEALGYADILLSFDKKSLAGAVEMARSKSWEDVAVMLPYLPEQKFLRSLTEPKWRTFYNCCVPQSLRLCGEYSVEYNETADELLNTLADDDFNTHRCVNTAAQCTHEAMPALIERYHKEPEFLNLLDMMTYCGEDFAERHASEIWQYDRVKNPQAVCDAIRTGADGKKYDTEELKDILEYVWYEIPYADERTLHRFAALLKDPERRKAFLSKKGAMRTAYLFDRTDVLAWEDTDWWKDYQGFRDKAERKRKKDDGVPVISYAIVTRKNNFLNITGGGDMEEFLRSEIYNPLPVLEKWFNLNTFNKKELKTLEERNINFDNIKKAAEATGEANLTFKEIELLTSDEVCKKWGTDGRLWTAKLLKAMLKGMRSEASCLRINQYMKALPKRVPLPENIDGLAELLLMRDVPTWSETLYDFKASFTLTAVSLPYRGSGVLDGLPDETSAWFAIRNMDAYMTKRNEGKDAETAIGEILDVDEDVVWLKKEMGLDESFYDEYADEVKKFFIEGNAAIAKKYMESLTIRRCEMFKLIAKAAMCGKLKKLRFQQNDIEIECGTALNADIKEVWIRDDKITAGQYTCGEDSTFKGIMEMGEKPVRTCMNYKNGMYNQCLMAYFDANKKVVYVRDKENKPTARAVLRMTQISLNGQGNSRLSFRDVEDEKAPGREQPAMFLEKMYSGYQGKQEEEMEHILISFAKQKAKTAGVPLVIANSYGKPEGSEMREVSVYITKSKAGEQYLDSFGGLAGPDERNDDRYVKGTFFVIPACND